MGARKHGPPPFGFGDKVKVKTSEEQLKKMQQGHGGWNPRMSEVRNISLISSDLNISLNKIKQSGVEDPLYYIVFKLEVVS